MVRHGHLCRVFGLVTFPERLDPIPRSRLLRVFEVAAFRDAAMVTETEGSVSAKKMGLAKKSLREAEWAGVLPTVTSPIQPYW